MKKIVISIAVFFIFLTPVYAAVPEISARHACLVVHETGDVIFEYNGRERAPMASTTKIMTALLTLENSGLDGLVTVSENAANQEGSSAYINTGDVLTVRDLLYGLMLNSGNDAAVALAEYVSGTSETFSELMTRKAHDLGAVNTSFENPNGLDSENHYTTAYDLSLIASYALKNEDFKKIVSCESKTVQCSSGKLFFSNHNKLLKNYNGCIGVKTGFTKKSGRCLVSAAERNGITLICVTLNAADDWNDHKKLLDYGFSMTEQKVVLKKGTVLKKINTNEKTVIPAVCEKDVCLPVIKGKHHDYELELHTINKIDAAVNFGEKIGEFEFYYKNKFICAGNVESGICYVPEENILNKILKLISNCYIFNRFATDIFF